MLHPQTLNGPVNHRLGNFQQMPNREHHGPVGTFQLIAAPISGDRGAAQKVGDIELRVLEVHVLADVVKAQFVRCAGMFAGEVKIDGVVKR